MAVTIESLKNPAGEIEPAVHFPRAKRESVAVWTARVDAYLTEWLAQGVVKAAPLAAIPDEANADIVTKKWATHLGLTAVYNRLLAMPSTVAIDEEGSSSFLVTQIERIGERAQELADEVEEILDELIEAEEITEPEVPHSRISPARFIW